MTTMASDIGKTSPSYAAAPLRHASCVCYTRSNFPDEADVRHEAQLPTWNADITARTDTPTGQDHTHAPVLRQGLSSVPQPQNSPTYSRLLGANDFYKFTARLRQHMVVSHPMLSNVPTIVSRSQQANHSRAFTAARPCIFTGRLPLK